MEEIVKVHFDSLDEKLLAQVMDTFYWIREWTYRKNQALLKLSLIHI